MTVLFLLWSLLGAALTWNVFHPLKWSDHGLFRLLTFSFGWTIGDLASHWVLLNLAIVGFFQLVGAIEGVKGFSALLICLISWGFLAYRHKKLSEVGPLLRRELNAALEEDYQQRNSSRTEIDSLTSSFDWKTYWIPTRLLRSPHLEIIPNIPFYQDRDIQLKLDIYRPSKAVSNSPILLQIHGGGWSFGSRNQGAPLMHRMVKQGWTCFSISYRKSPQYLFPKQIVDCKRALSWIKEHASEYGGNSDFIIATGGSAGGHLASLTALTANSPEFQPGFESSDTQIQGCVSFYGIYDLEAPFNPPVNRPFAQVLKMVMGGLPQNFPKLYRQASPIHRISEIPQGGSPPPFMILQGEADALVSVDEAERFYQALRQANTPHLAFLKLPLIEHAFDNFPSLATHQVLPSVEQYLVMLYSEYLQNSA